MEGKCMPYEQTWWQVLTFSGVVGKRGMKKKLGGRNRRFLIRYWVVRQEIVS